MFVLRLFLLMVSILLFLVFAHQANAQEGKEYVPVNKRFKIVIPPGDKTGQSTRIIALGKNKVPIESSYSQTKNGVTYTAGSIGIPAKVIAGIPAGERFDRLRDAIVKSMGGKVVDEKDLKQGMISGKDYQIEGKKMARMQMYMQGGFVFLAIVEGTKEEITSKTADAFFKSFIMTPEVAEGK
jgi:hypothetical protein